MSPQHSPPVQPPPALLDNRGTPPTKTFVTVLRGFAHDRLVEVERSWGQARDRLAEAMAATGFRLESGHWRWTRKDAATRAGEYILLAVEAGGDIQGLLALKTRLRASALVPGGWVLYVDYIESAPWNLHVENVQRPRFAGVGTLLIGEAVRTSMGRVCGGRLGLHSLPQAEAFYGGRCRMTRIGPDPSYNQLVYFEHAVGVPADWLSEVGLSS